MRRTPERPWHGISPIGYARLSGKLAANLELRLAEEAGARVGYLLPIPGDGGDGGTDDSLSSLKNDLAALAGNTALVETVSSGWAEGRAAAPQSDWKPQRMGADPPETLAELRGAAGLDVLSACGIPPGSSVRPIRRDFGPEGELEKIRAHDAGLSGADRSSRN